MAPPPRRVQRSPVHPVEQMRRVMVRWVKKLRTSTRDSATLEYLFKDKQERTSFGRLFQCGSETVLDRIVTSANLNKPWRTGAHTFFPAFFLYAKPPPSSLTPPQRKLYLVTAGACLVKIMRVRRRLTLVAVKVRHPDRKVDKAVFVRKGRCLFMELTASRKVNNAALGIRLLHRNLHLVPVGAVKPKPIGSYTLRSKEWSGTGDLNEVTGTVRWAEVKGRHYLIYKSTTMELPNVRAPQPTFKKEVGVQRLTARCTLKKINAAELARLRKLPGGEVLPKRLRK